MTQRKWEKRPSWLSTSKLKTSDLEHHFRMCNTCDLFLNCIYVTHTWLHALHTFYWNLRIIVVLQFPPWSSDPNWGFRNQFKLLEILKVALFENFRDWWPRCADVEPNARLLPQSRRCIESVDRSYLWYFSAEARAAQEDADIDAVLAMDEEE